MTRVTGLIDTGTETVRAWTEAGVGVIELNRPRRRNALHPDMFDAVPRLVERFNDDSDVGCILVTGAGKAFCAGGDVKARPGDNGWGGLAHSARMVLLLHESPKISVAALPGPAAGAGIGIALCTDLRIAAESAALLTAWSTLGFSGDFGGTWFLTRLLGPGRAIDLLVNNGRIDAETGLRLGVFNRVVRDADLRTEAMAWATTIAAGPRAAWQYMKENVRDAVHMDLRDHLVVEGDRMRRSGQTEDHRQAVQRWLAQDSSKRSV